MLTSFDAACCVAAAATPASAPTVAQWVAATQTGQTNGAGSAALGSVVVAALVAVATLVLV